jgi:hypothetical protein
MDENLSLFRHKKKAGFIFLKEDTSLFRKYWKKGFEVY